MAEIKKTILKEVSSRTKDGLDTPVPVGVEFENVIDTRTKYDKHYSLDQFFDHYMNYMQNADFLYYGNTEPVNEHSCIWIDTSSEVYYQINESNSKYELVLSSNPLFGGIENGTILQKPTSGSSYWPMDKANKFYKIIIQDEIFPITMDHWFQYCYNATFEGLEKINTSMTTDLTSCFNSSSLKDISALAKWDTSNVIHFRSCFSRCSKLANIDPLRNWKTDSLETIYECFNECDALEDISALSNWKTDNAELFSNLFANCSSLKSVEPIKNWNTKNVTRIYRCFAGTSSITTYTPLNNWSMPRLSDHQYAFLNTTGTLPSWFTWPRGE